MCVFVFNTDVMFYMCYNFRAYLYTHISLKKLHCIQLMHWETWDVKYIYMATVLLKCIIPTNAWNTRNHVLIHMCLHAADFGAAFCNKQLTLKRNIGQSADNLQCRSGSGKKDNRLNNSTACSCTAHNYAQLILCMQEACCIDSMKQSIDKIFCKWNLDRYH